MHLALSKLSTFKLMACLDVNFIFFTLVISIHSWTPSHSPFHFLFCQKLCARDWRTNLISIRCSASLVFAVGDFIYIPLTLFQWNYLLVKWFLTRVSKSKTPFSSNGPCGARSWRWARLLNETAPEMSDLFTVETDSVQFSANNSNQFMRKSIKNKFANARPRSRSFTCRW